MSNETNGSIDNSLIFMQLSNAAWLATYLVTKFTSNSSGNTVASNITDLNTVVVMQTINDLVNYLEPAPPTSLNPNAFALWTILKADLLNRNYSEQNTTLASICANYGVAPAYPYSQSLTNSITYFGLTNFQDLQTTTNFTIYNGDALIDLLDPGTISPAYINMCNKEIFTAIGWPNYPSGSKTPDLYSTISDFNTNHSNAQTGTIINIKNAISAFIEASEGASDGYLTVLNKYLKSCVNAPISSSTLSSASSSQLEDILNGKGYDPTSQPFFNIINWVIQKEYLMNAGKPDLSTPHCSDAYTKYQWYQDHPGGWNPKQTQVKKETDVTNLGVCMTGLSICGNSCCYTGIVNPNTNIWYYCDNNVCTPCQSGEVNCGGTCCSSDNCVNNACCPIAGTSYCNNACNTTCTESILSSCCCGSDYCDATQTCCGGACYTESAGTCCDNVWYTTAGTCCGNLWYPTGSAGICCGNVWNANANCCTSTDCKSPYNCCSSTEGSPNQCGIYCKGGSYSGCLGNCIDCDDQGFCQQCASGYTLTDGYCAL